MDLKKITLPTAIIVAAIVLAMGFYVVQNNKQESIERQQLLKLQEEKTQQELENKRAELTLKQEECKSLSSGVMKKWNNVMGVTYSEFWEECVVTYTNTETGEVETSPLRLMQDVK